MFKLPLRVITISVLTHLLLPIYSILLALVLINKNPKNNCSTMLTDVAFVCCTVKYVASVVWLLCLHKTYHKVQLIDVYVRRPWCSDSVKHFTHSLLFALRKTRSVFSEIFAFIYRVQLHVSRSWASGWSWILKYK